jgi:hypothetical protein
LYFAVACSRQLFYMKFYFLGSRGTLVSYVVQSKNLRVLVDPFGGVPSMFDMASIDVVLISHVGGAVKVSEVLSAPGFRARVLCSEGTAVLCRILVKGIQRIAMGQRVSILGKDVVVEALSSGHSLGGCNWKLYLWGRVVSLLGESSLWPNRHCLPFDMELLADCHLLVAAVARGAVGGDAQSLTRLSSELRSLLAAGPVAVPLGSLTSPLLFDLLDVLRELVQPIPTTVLVAREANALIASVTVLGECFDSSRLARVHNAESPLALLPQVVASLSLPIQGRAQNLYFTDNLLGLLAAIGPSCVVVSCDPNASPSTMPAGTRFLPLDTGLTTAQVRHLCARVGQTVTVAPNSPFPVAVRIQTASALTCSLVSPLPPVAGVVRVLLSGSDVALVPARSRPPDAEQLVRALRRVGVSLMRYTKTEDGFSISFPSLQDSRIVVSFDQTKIVAFSSEAFELLSNVINKQSEQQQ